MVAQSAFPNKDFRHVAQPRAGASLPLFRDPGP